MKKITGKDGGVLVMVMVVMLAFSVLAIGLYKLHDTDALETVYVKHTAQAFWVAEAGLQRTLSGLRTDKAHRKDIADHYDSSSPYIETGTVGGNGSYSVELWGDGSISNFSMRSRGTVMEGERLLSLDAVLTPFGPHGLVTLDGDSLIKDGATINGSIYQNGKLTTRGDVDITGDVLAENYEDFSAGVPIPEDGYIDMHIETDYFAPYLAMISALSATTNAASITNTLDLVDQTIVVDSSIDPALIISTGGTGTNGVLVVKGDQTFSKDLTIGDYVTIIVGGDLKMSQNLIISNNVTIIVDGNLKISKNGTFGDNVTIFATGEIDLFKDATAEAITGTGCTILSLGDAKVWKEFTFDGIFFTEGTFYADKDLDVTGTIITQDGFTLKKDATVNFDESVIPEDTYNDMISLSFIVSQSTWNELPAN